MYMMAAALREWVRDQGGKVTYIGDAAERLDIIGDALRATKHTAKTAPGPARGIGLQIRFGAHNRLVYFFDAAGEMYTSDERLPQLRFLDKAKTYVFVVDPLSSKGVWSQLSAADQDRLQPFRTEAREIDLSYQATLRHMLKIAQQRKRLSTRSDLAFVVSKLDLLQAAGVNLDDTMRATEAWVSQESGLDLGDISRGARHSFKDVNFLYTAATEEDGQVSQSVEDLLFWIFGQSGIRVSR